MAVFDGILSEFFRKQWVLQEGSFRLWVQTVQQLEVRDVTGRSPSVGAEVSATGTTPAEAHGCPQGCTATSQQEASSSAGPLPSPAPSILKG